MLLRHLRSEVDVEHQLLFTGHGVLIIGRRRQIEEGDGGSRYPLEEMSNRALFIHSLRHWSMSWAILSC